MVASRRDFMHAGLWAAAAAAVHPRLLAAPSSVPFLYCRWDVPVISTGEPILFQEPIRCIELFEPLFGKDRNVVNPSMPQVFGKRMLRFQDAGEYYLRMNQQTNVKVLVLQEGEPPSASVLRLFDFCVANLVFSGIQDGEWYGHRLTGIQRWLESDSALSLSCGPTHQLFRDMIKRRFGLPTRSVAIVGALFGPGDNPGIEVHNVAEVYLPDLERWVLFDVNNAFVPLWMDAMELAKKVSESWTLRYDSKETVAQLPVRLHLPMETYMPEPVESVVSDSHVITPTLPPMVPVSERRERALRLYASGPAYWGRESRFAASGGTEFLPYDYAWAATWCHVRLANVIMQWIENDGHRISPLDPTAMRRLLAEGHSARIARAAWKAFLPAYLPPKA